MDEKELMGFTKLLFAGLKKPLTKVGLVMILLVITIFEATFLIKFIEYISPNLEVKLKIAVIALPYIAYLFLWTVFRWIKSFSYTACSIGIAIEHNSENLRVYEESVARAKKALGQLGVPKLKVIIYDDHHFDNDNEASKFLDDKGLTILIWGRINNGTRNSKSLSTFEVRTTYHVEALVPDKKQFEQILRNIETGSRREKWTVDLVNSENDISIIKENIVEIGMFALGICLSYFPTSEIQQLGLQTLMELKNKYFSKGGNNISRRNAIIVTDNIVKALLVQNAEVAILNKRFGRAIEILQDIILIFPNDQDAHILLGYSLWKNGQKKDAKECADKLWRLNPGSPPGRINKAFFSITKKQYKIALKQYKTLRTLGIGNVESLWSIEFLNEEYKKNNSELGYLFGSGFLSIYWGEKEMGLADLKKFAEQSTGISEYVEMRNCALGILQMPQ